MLIRFIRREPLLFVLAVLFLFLIIFFPKIITISALNFPINTLAAITGLILVTRGIEESGYFSHIAEKILAHQSSSRKISLFLILLTAFLSSFLTNDISLFIVVPLTVAMGKRSGRDIVKMVIFEAIAANVGSSLTPIGNPQNLYLWDISGMSFGNFIFAMLIPFGMMIVILLLMAYFTFPNERVEVKFNMPVEKNRSLFSISFILLIVFLIAVNFRLALYFLPVILAVLFFTGKEAIKNADWPLILVFTFIFIDFYSLSLLLPFFAPQNSFEVFLSTAILSQGISNVPATVLVSGKSANYVAIAWGSNVGGNGTAIASLANIIAMRLSGENMLKEFHRYSVPFFMMTLLLVLIYLWTYILI